MNAALLLDAGLCLLILTAAVLAMTGRDLFGAIAFFIVYGILIALAWVRLEAVDVALAEAAIGAGLTGVLLIGAWSLLRRVGVSEAHELSHGGLRLVAGIASAATTFLLAAAVLALPAGREGLAPLVAERLADHGVSNPVTGVLLDFRAYDTLMESIVLLVALVAVWALTPASVWGGVPGMRQHARPDGVLAMFGRLLPPIGLVMAVYLVWAGSSQPGGAFQAGTVLAAVWLLVVMAGIHDEPRVTSGLLRTALVAGPAVFLAIGIAGLGTGALLSYPADYAYGLILLIEFTLTFSIGATLALLVAGRARRMA
ncbi:MAG: hydrogenase subunit MbhD domain-containing protein [Rhizobiaceae bacterium]